MLTHFGKLLRKLRIDCGEVTRDMSEQLGCTASYLSAIETGKRPIPDGWAEKIISLYHLEEADANQLREAVLEEIKAVKIDISKLFGCKRELAILFVQNLTDMEESTAEIIIELLKNSKQE